MVGRWASPVQAVPENARPLLSEVRPDPRVAPLVRELLAAVYLVGSLEEAASEDPPLPTVSGESLAAEVERFLQERDGAEDLDVARKFSHEDRKLPGFVALALA